MGELTIGILTCVWKRHELAEAMLRHTRDVAPRCLLVAVGSEGVYAEEIVRRSLWNYVEAPNDPRGAKWNAGLARLRDLGADAVLILGSDDFASAEYLRAAFAMARTPGLDYGGLLDCYVWRAADEAAVHWPGYPERSQRHGETIGSGRWFGPRALDAVGWKLWPEDDRKIGLDAAAMARLRAAPGLVHAPIRMGFGAALIDVKANQNGADIGSFSEMAEGSERVTTEAVFAAMPPALLPTLQRVGDPVPKAPLFLPCDAPRISAAMIAKDGSPYLGACLRSLVGLVDEVTVLVDAASTDRTEVIARAAGARVFVEPWRGFGPQRTRSLELARGEWAFVIDCDEVLVDAGDMRQVALDAPDELDGIMLRIPTGANTGQVLESQTCRMVRRTRASYRFRRHNELMGIRRVRPSMGVMRTSYAGRLGGRSVAEIPELLEEHAEFPAEQHAPYYLARAYRALGQWEEARRWARVCIEMDPDTLKGGGAFCELAHATAADGAVDAAHEVVAEGIRRHPGYADLHQIRAALALHQWAQATVNPGRYAVIPQASTVESVMHLPAAARALGLPLRYERPE